MTWRKLGVSHTVLDEEGPTPQVEEGDVQAWQEGHVEAKGKGRVVESQLNFHFEADSGNGEGRAGESEQGGGRIRKRMRQQEDKTVAMTLGRPPRGSTRAEKVECRVGKRSCAGEFSEAP